MTFKTFGRKKSCVVSQGPFLLVRTISTTFVYLRKYQPSELYVGRCVAVAMFAWENVSQANSMWADVLE